MPLSPELVDLARAYDVVTDYVDWKGRQVYVPTATVEAVLSAMGVDLGDPASALRRRREDAWRRALPPCVVATRGTARWVPVHVTHGDAVQVVAELEDGTVRELAQVDNWVEPREVDGRLVGEATFEVPGDLPLGYHRLRAGSGRRSSSAPLIMTPAFLGLPESLRDRQGVGFRGAALQRALTAVLGRRRPRRPGPPRRVVRRRSSARTSCWSTRCTPRSRPRRWSRRRTCRRRGGSSTRCTCGSSEVPEYADAVGAGPRRGRPARGRGARRARRRAT